MSISVRGLLTISGMSQIIRTNVLIQVFYQLLRQWEAELELESTQIGVAVTESGIGAPDSDVGASGADAQDRAVGREKGAVRCLRCNSLTTIALDKMVADANTCYLCRTCGHIFSPSASVPVVQR